MSIQFLTKNAIDLMFTKKEPLCIVQILELQDMAKPGTSTEKFRVTISDGFAKEKVIFGNTAGTDMSLKKAQKYSIIKINDVVYAKQPNDKTLLIIINFETIYKEVDEMIGDPIEYKNFKSEGNMNNNGSSIIPAKYCKGGSSGSAAPAGQSNSSFSMNQLKSNLPNTINSNPAANKGPVPASNTSNKPPAQTFNNNTMGNNLNTNNQKPGNFQGQKAMTNNKPAQTKTGPVRTYNEPSENFMPFSALTAVSDAWRIKGRILKKSDMRTWKSAKGTGTVFQIDLLDHHGNEISASFFNDNRFFEMLEEGGVYTFSGGTVKLSNSKWSKNDYQITFDERAIIDKSVDDGSIALQKFAFTKIEKMKDMPAGQSVDVIAIVLNPGEAQNQVLRSGEHKLRRNIILYDDSLYSIELTLWGDIAKTNFEKDQIVAIRDVKINEYNNTKNISGSFNTAILPNGGNVKEGSSLSNWKDLNDIREDDIKPISDRGPAQVRKMKTLEKMEEEASKLTSDGERLFSDVVFSVVYLRMEGTMYYLACHNDKCSKKIQDFTNTGYRCENCTKVFNEPPKARYVLSAKIMDSTHAVWISIGDEAGREILSRPAQDIREMKEQGKDHEITEIGKEVYFKEFRGRIMSKLDSYNNSTNIRHSLSRVFPRDLKKETAELINEINEYLKL